MMQVCQRTQLITQLTHSLSFATDEEINNRLLLKYGLCEYLTPCDAHNTNILNNCILSWRHEAEQYFKTTILNYDPLSNFSMREDSTDERTPDLARDTTYGKSVGTTYGKQTDVTYGKSVETELGTTHTNSASGYNYPAVLVDDSETVGSGSDTTTASGTDTTTLSGTDTTAASGTDTVKTTGKDTITYDRYRRGYKDIPASELIEKERKIIADAVEWYVEKFRSCFDVSMDIDDYGWCHMNWCDDDNHVCPTWDDGNDDYF